MKCAVTLSTASVSAGGGTGTITVTTGQECGWSASTQFGWIAGLSPTSGQGNGQVAFNVGPNPLQTERQGEVVVNDSRVQIRQEAATCQFTISSNNQDFASAGGTGTVTIAGIQGCPWTARSNAAWITVTSPSSGEGSGVVEFQVAFNSQVARVGTLSIAGRDFTVSQSGEVTSPPPTSPPPTPSPDSAAAETADSATTDTSTTDAAPPTPPPPTPTPPTCTYDVASGTQAFPHGGGRGRPDCGHFAEWL